ncbi:MAG: hypothetical protein ACI9HK_000961, partial [Pirellulaceae bacterium]
GIGKLLRVCTFLREWVVKKPIREKLPQVGTPQRLTSGGSCMSPS